MQAILSTGIDRDCDTIQVLIKQNPTSENFPRISVCGVFVIKLDDWFKDTPSVFKKRK